MNRYLFAAALVIAVGLAPIPLHAATKPTITVAPTSCGEVAGVCNVAIRKTAASSYTKLTVSTVDLSARAGVDYQAVTRSVTIGNAAQSINFPVNIINNSVVDGTRTFGLRVTVVRNGIVSGANPSTVSIVDDDVAPTPPPVATRDPTYGDLVTALQACSSSQYSPDPLVVGQTYKVVGLGSTMAVPIIGAPVGTKADTVILNPVPDDGKHRGDGYFGLWEPMTCVSRPPVAASAPRVMGQRLAVPALDFALGRAVKALKSCFEANDTQGHGNYLTQPGLRYALLPTKAGKDRVWAKALEGRDYTGVFMRTCFAP